MTTEAVSTTEAPEKTKRPVRAPAAPGYKQPQDVIRAYIAFRRAQLAQISGPAGLNRGGSGPILAAARAHILDELDLFSDWLDEGQPSPLAILSPDDREFWKNARRRGMTVPPEILSQLD